MKQANCYPILCFNCCVDTYIPVTVIPARNTMHHAIPVMQTAAVFVLFQMGEERAAR
jgi:hypothetical protein